jgi:AI2M/AI1M-like, HNH endonuclease
MARKYAATIDMPHGPRVCLQATVHRSGRKALVATFGGIPLRRHKTSVLTDRDPTRDLARGSELIRRLLAGRCELCGQAEKVQIHQIRTLADLDQTGQPQPEWMRIMAKRRRKTLVVCDACHASIHDGKPSASTRIVAGAPSEPKGSRRVSEFERRAPEKGGSVDDRR